MKKLSILIFFLCNLFSQISHAQYTNNIWCFGDSAGINFNSNPSYPITSGLRTKNGSASIADSAGNLLFYGSGYDDSTNSSGSSRAAILKNRLNQTMQNGTNIIGEWYHTMTIVTKSVTDSTFYVFVGGVTYDFGLYLIMPKS